MSSTVWRVAPADPGLARRLAGRLGIHPLTAQLLLNRGLTDHARAAQFLHPGLDALGDPFALPDAETAVRRLREAVARQEPITVFGDSDVDGLTASVILYEALRQLGGRATAVQSNRLADGYGLPGALVRRLCRAGPALLVLVDCGTNQAEEIRRLAAHGVDTIVVDHHVPLGQRARPRALVNPHAAAGAAGREMCSAGLAFKLVQALLEDEGTEALAAYLDLAALGTLADYSTLVGDNRILVSEGLPRIVRSRRVGLQRLCAATGTRSPEPEQVLRRLIPRLNAGGRLGEAATVWKLLLAEQDTRLEAWLAATQAAHTELKGLHRQTLSQAHEQVNRMHFKEHRVLLVHRAGWPQGLMGPVAAQLARQYGRPAIAIAMEDPHGVGSGRSTPLFNLLAAVQACERWLVRFGGHAQACGLTVAPRHLEAFRAQVNEEARSQLQRAGVTAERPVDLELALEQIEPGWVGELQRLKPFGAGNPKPTVVIRRVQIEPRSARIATIADGRRQCLARGEFGEAVRGGRYDVLASPALVTGELELSVGAVRVAAAPCALGPT